MTTCPLHVPLLYFVLDCAQHLSEQSYFDPISLAAMQSGASWLSGWPK